MSSAEVSAVLRHIRHLAAARHAHEVPDDQLLARFVARRDEDAFATLLKRHGPMVLGVCRSVLRNLHDAEDAFQAAFLLLAQKAGSIQRRESVSGWLYRVAYHLAVRTGAAASRRRVHETRAVTMPSADPLLDMSLREVRGVLFEELEKLPEQYRTLLVLCALEEKSRDEAARLLGWSRNAVKGKLERGRELLRSRLRRRGLELPAGLFAAALAVNSASGQVSATLVDSTLRAAVQAAAGAGAVAGAVSAEVAALVQGASKTLFPGKTRIATALFLAIGLAASCFGAMWHPATAADEPAVRAGQPEAPPKPAADVAVEVRGRVLDPDGKPVAGAKLYLNTYKPDVVDYPVRASSGADGRFAFSFNRSELNSTWTDTPTGTVITVAKEFGCDLATVGRPGDAGELTLRLVKDVPLSGRVLDQEGNPVAGATVSVTGIQAYKGEDLTPALVEFRKDFPVTSPVKVWSGPLPGPAASVTTGADGRFRLSGIGRERLVDLKVEGPGIEYVRLQAMTRAGEPVVNSNSRKIVHPKIYDATFDYLAAPARPIRGVVRDKATGKPVPGVRVESYGTTRTVQTDENGRYELPGHAKSRDYHLMAIPPAGQPYFTANVRPPDTPGFTPLVTDIELVRGILVRGRVTDSETGQPIRGADVRCFAIYPNPNAREGIGEGMSGVSSATTGPDGSYAVVALPGPGVIAVTAHSFDNRYMPALLTVQEMKEFYKTWVFPEGQRGAYSEKMLLQCVGTHISGLIQDNYNVLAMIEPDAKSDTLTRDVVVPRAQSLRGSVTGPDGKALAGATAFGLVAHVFSSTTLETADFTVSGINPKRTRELLFIHSEKGLGFHRELRGDEKGPLTIRLQPLGTASARVLDKDKQPVTGMLLKIFRQALIGPGGQEVKTDKDGRFRTSGLVPGQKYGLYSADGSLRLSKNFDLVVESGKDKDLGDLQVDSAR
jgi:RNA polymerase sigma factor (sigma-70 family)